jgi:hypothetical protein
VKLCLTRPVAFHAILGHISGSANAGLMLSQAYYWSQRTTDKDGWFYKTMAEWWEETCLSRTEQETARKKLTERGFIIEKRAGRPAKLYFKVDTDAIAAAIVKYAENPQTKIAGNQQSKIAENLQTRLQKTSKLDCGKPANKIAGNQQSLNKESETTAETTTETTAERQHGAASHAAPAAIEVVIELPLNDGTLFPVTQSQVDEFVSLYPAVDVYQKLRDMKGWLIGHPKNRKTRSGVLAFVTTWLKREQDSAPVAKNGRFGYPTQPEQPAAQSRPDKLPADFIETPEANAAWVSIKGDLENRINRHTFDTWLKPLRAFGYSDRTLYVHVPTPEFKQVGERWGELIGNAIDAKNLPIDGVEFVFTGAQA